MWESHLKASPDFGQADADVVGLSLEPDWGKPNVRNLREGTGNVRYGGTRNPLLNRKRGCRKLST